METFLWYLLVGLVLITAIGGGVFFGIMLKLITDGEFHYTNIADALFGDEEAWNDTDEE